jgi:hypothetical protein
MINNPDEAYNGNPNVKRDGVVQRFTNAEIAEYMKCSNDAAYFARTYCKIINLDRGLVNFELYPYQERMFKRFNEERFNIVLACRQSGKSISSVCYLLWYALFHPEQLVAILANKGDTAREMLGRLTLMLENIPFFLQPGCKALNKGSIDFSNNSRIIARATGGSSIRGLSVNLLYLDEFAFIDNATKFYTATYPVISSGKSTKIIITSTANGIGNPFHTIWEAAVQGTNDYKPFRVDWWDVPGRDEAWKIQQIANTSQLQFDQEFGNTFLGTGDTLFDAECLMSLRSELPIHILEKNRVRIYEEVVEGHDYVMTVDVAKGVGGDFSTFNVIDLSQQPFKQVAVFQDNKISPLLFPNIIHKYATLYNKAYVVIESNDQGMLVAKGLYYDLEYEEMFVESSMKADALGLTMNKKVKRLGCAAIKEIAEANTVKVVDMATIREMSTFTARGLSYEASEGNHDDLVMNLVVFGYFTLLPKFNELVDINMKNLMHQQHIEEMELDIPPFGFIDDGLPNLPAVFESESQRGAWQIVKQDDDYAPNSLFL